MPPKNSERVKKPMTKRQAWLEERKTYIGASEAAAALGENPHMSLHELWCVKKGLTVVEENTAMRRGNAMEPFIANEYRLITGFRPERSRLYRHPVYPCRACNPDREVQCGEHRGILQLKDVGYWAGMQFGLEGADQIPRHYMIQIVDELTLTKMDFVQLVACVDGREPRIFTYSFDPNIKVRVSRTDKGLYAKVHILDKDFGRDIFSGTVHAWNTYFEGDVEPPITGHDCDTEFVKRERASYDNGRVINADQEIENECRKLLESSKPRFSKAELLKKERENRIKLFMARNNAEVLGTKFGNFTYKTSSAGVSSFRTPAKSGKV